MDDTWEKWNANDDNHPEDRRASRLHWHWPHGAHIFWTRATGVNRPEVTEIEGINALVDPLEKHTLRLLDRLHFVSGVKPSFSRRGFGTTTPMRIGIDSGLSAQ